MAFFLFTNYFALAFIGLQIVSVKIQLYYKDKVKEDKEILFQVFKTHRKNM